jgi:hypothetical protein
VTEASILGFVAEAIAVGVGLDVSVDHGLDGTGGIRGAHFTVEQGRCGPDVT